VRKRKVGGGVRRGLERAREGQREGR